MSVELVFQAQAAFQEQLLAKPNVVGVAVGRKNLVGELSVVTLVQQKKPIAALSAEEMVPKQLDGVRTDVVEVGYLRAYATPRDRYRPTIPCGVSIGHYKITAGTLGAIVTDRNTGEKLILSNNHVLANSNDALVGDPILQPGPTDGGQNPGDIVARLERFVRLRYEGDPPSPEPPAPPPPSPPPGGGCDVVSVVVGLTNGLATLLGSSQRVTTAAPSTTVAPQAQPTDNDVDAALAKPVDPNMFTGEILAIGAVSGTKPPQLGAEVRKSGRTTGYTEGVITLINATVSVAYGNRTARFVGQIISSPMSQGGDSGSLIVDKAENRAVGLLFAGSNLATIFTPMDKVLEALQVNI
ncbi:MAG: hypothetical protein HZC41_23600 [Chloroflexi bacterium]|nr:hypothetical protein [Chloroflexota bacterium]